MLFYVPISLLEQLFVFARGLVGEHLAHLRLFQLAFRILVEAADPDVADTMSLQDASIGWMGLRWFLVPLRPKP